jgi:hypothetical protein
MNPKNIVFERKDQLGVSTNSRKSNKFAGRSWVFWKNKIFPNANEINLREGTLPPRWNETNLREKTFFELKTVELRLFELRLFRFLRLRELVETPIQRYGWAQ